MIEYFIIALNEESNILECINSIKDTGNNNVVVLDGGSTDRTAEIASDADCLVVNLPQTSISYRRGYAIDNAKSEFICFVDADQRLTKYPDISSKLIAYFEEDENLAGVQFSLTADDSCRGYWAKGFAKRLELITGIQGLRKVIGTPCVFRLNIAKKIGYEKSLTGPSDDTLFCSKLIDAGFKLIAISEKASEVVRASFKGTIKKAFWYGRGDAEYIHFDENNRRRHLYHVFVRGPFIYPAIVSIKNISLVPFFIIFGFTRAAGLIYGVLTKHDLTKTYS